jgi:hypothetical protein
VIQSVRPLHECVGPTATESVAVESTAEPLHSVTDSTTAGAAPTETS